MRSVVSGRTTLTTLALAASIGSWSGGAGAVPLSSRPTGPGPHYFGYFASAMDGVGVPSGGCPSGDYTACVADHANVTLVVGQNPGTTGWVASITDKVKEASDLGMGVVLAISPIFFTVDPTTGALIPKTGAELTAAWQYWQQLATALTPYKSKLVSFYVVDEPPTDPTMLAFISTVSNGLGFAGVHRQVTFLAESLRSDFTIPHGVDWVGYDCYVTTSVYPTFQQCSGPGFASIPFYNGRLKAIMRQSSAAYAAAHQTATTFGVVLFPIAWEGALPAPPDGSPQTLLGANNPDLSVDAQARILARAEREVVMAENDPDYVMVMPFLWQSDFAGRAGAQGFVGVGVNQLPTVKAYYQALGKHVTMAGMDRLAYPTSVTASVSAAGAPPNLAFDYDDSTAWNAGTYAPSPLLVAAFSDPISVTRVTSVIAQSPSSAGAFLVTGHFPNGSTANLQTFTGTLTDGLRYSTASLSTQPVVAVDTTTQSSLSWIARRELDLMTSGSNRLYAYPFAQSGTADVPQNISDADPSTMWNAGQYGVASPAPFIELDLGRTRTIKSIQLLVAQSPNGTTTHRILGGPTSARSSMSVLATLTSSTFDGERLSFDGNWANVRYIYIETTDSPSWVAWREAEIFQ